MNSARYLEGLSIMRPGPWDPRKTRPWIEGYEMWRAERDQEERDARSRMSARPVGTYLRAAAAGGYCPDETKKYRGERYTWQGRLVTVEQVFDGGIVIVQEVEPNFRPGSTKEDGRIRHSAWWYELRVP